MPCGTWISRGSSRRLTPSRRSHRCAESMTRLLERLGLGRPDLRAWAMYDWANSAVQTTIIAAIFPIYFQKVAAAGLPGPVATSRFAWATTWAILIVAVIAPLLGAMADYAAAKKK